ncbi:hypothetical protein HDU76_008680 [Blyttiomyces sp. JEL0837]|nr:hypothetical protein HDU76_008680 [Blyttiomyces sp. JEL0837]
MFSCLPGYVNNPNLLTDSAISANTQCFCATTFQSKVAAGLLDCTPSNAEYTFANRLMKEGLAVCFSGTDTTNGTTATTGGGGGSSTGNANNGNNGSSGSSNTPMIAGIAGGVVVLLGIGVAVFVVMKKKSNARKRGDKGPASNGGFANDTPATAALLELAKLEQAKLSSANPTGLQYNYGNPNVYNRYDTKPAPTQPEVSFTNFAPPLVHAPDIPNQSQPTTMGLLHNTNNLLFLGRIKKTSDQNVSRGRAYNGTVSGERPYASAQHEKMQFREKLARQQQQEQQGSAGAISKSSVTWSVQDVTQWLLDSGLDTDIVKCFADHQVTGLILQRLTVDTLKLDLGIQSLRTRTNIMTRIDQLKSSENLYGGFNQSGHASPPALLCPSAHSNSLRSQPTQYQYQESPLPPWNQNQIDQNVVTGSVSGERPYVSAQNEKMQLREKLARQQPEQQGLAPKPSVTWSIQDVNQWLLDGGLDTDIVKCFAVHEVDGLILQRLTVDTLKLDLGIQSLRTRTNIMTRIDQLKNSENSYNLFNHNGHALPPAYGPF